jgi:hypothetical protein
MRDREGEPLWSARGQAGAFVDQPQQSGGLDLRALPGRNPIYPLNVQAEILKRQAVDAVKNRREPEVIADPVIADAIRD